MESLDHVIVILEQMTAKRERAEGQHRDRQKQWEEKSMTDLEEKEATDLETNPEEMQSEAVHEEVPKEEAAVKPVRPLKKRHRGRIQP
jgi:protein subunit release factor B